MLTIVLSFLVAFLLALFLRYRFKTGSMMELSEKIPGPKTLPLIGNALEMGFRTDGFLDNMHRLTRQHGPLTRIWLGDVLVVMMSDPKDIEVILGSNKLLDKAYIYDYLWPWLGDGLLTSTGQKWRVHRKLFTPTFHFKILEEFVEVFNTNEKIMVERMKKQVGGPGFDVCPYITLCGLDIICETAMGVSVNAQRESDSEYVQAVRDMGDVVMQRGFKPWLKPEFLFQFSPLSKVQEKSLKILHGMTNSVIRTRKAEYAKKKQNTAATEDNDVGAKRRLAFLDLLLQAQQDGATITDEQIREEVDTFMFEGHDTTTSGICFTLWALAKHQHVQDKVVEELNSIFGGSDRDATFNDLQEMKYMEQVIKEAQRMFPTVPLYGRKLTENVKLDGHTLPVGANIVLLTYMIHRRPEHFPDPEKFDPDRFLPENCVGRHPYCFVPFSAGPRNCIGQKFAIMEMKMTLGAILRNFKLTLMEPHKDVRFMVELVLKAPDGVNIKLETRNKT